MMRRLAASAGLLLACGPAPPGEDSSADPPAAAEATSDAAGSTTLTPSSECRSIDLPCPDWCATDFGCPLGQRCVDEACTHAPRLPACAELALAALMLLPGDGDGGFTCEALVPVPAPVPHELLAVGDGRPDIVTASPAAGELRVLRGL